MTRRPAASVPWSVEPRFASATNGPKELKVATVANTAPSALICPAEASWMHTSICRQLRTMMPPVVSACPRAAASRSARCEPTSSALRSSSSARRRSPAPN